MPALCTGVPETDNSYRQSLIYAKADTAREACGSEIFDEPQRLARISLVFEETEVEEFQVELSDVTALELAIVPDISRGSARASLKSLRLS